MTDDETPLLSTPSLTALILRQAKAGPVTLDGLAAALDALFGVAREAPVLTADQRLARLSGNLRDLAIARLLEPAGDGAWRLTDRGRDALILNPEGVDASELVGYPEFAAHIRATQGVPAGMDPRAASYDEGYDAGRAGQSFTLNPYTPNTVDHQSWENGWMQALDDGGARQP